MMLITVSQFKFLGLGHSNCQFTFQRQQNLQVLRHLKASLLRIQQISILRVNGVCNQTVWVSLALSLCPVALPTQTMSSFVGANVACCSSIRRNGLVEAGSLVEDVSLL